MNDKDAKALLEEVKALKMLTILQLINQGVKQRQIAEFLGVHETTVGRMLPKTAKARRDLPAKIEEPSSAGQE